MEVSFTDGSGYSVRILVRAVTLRCCSRRRNALFDRPNSHSDCVHSSADRALMLSVMIPAYRVSDVSTDYAL
jgi:hypothetical protein